MEFGTGNLSINAKKILTVIILIFVATNSFAQINEGKDFTLEKLKDTNTETDRGARYHIQYANNRYLLYVEYFRQEVFLYDLKNEEVIYSKMFSQGKGPFEFTSITGAVIVNNYIYVSSSQELKFIKIDVNSGNMEELRLDAILARDLNVYNGGILIKNRELTRLFMKYDLEEKKEDILEFDGFEPIKEFSHLFYKEGDFSISKDKLLFTTTYLPYIYVFDLNQKTLVEKIKFDISEIEEPRIINLGNGDVAELPPKSNIKTIEIAGVPGNSRRVLIVTEGKGKNSIYDFFSLYEYDLLNKKFTNRYPFHAKIRSIVSNDKHVFINSFDDSGIYKLTIKN